MKRVSIVVILCLFVFLCSCTGGSRLYTKTQEGLLGTVITISSYDAISSDLFAECFELVEDVDARMSVTRAGSDISAVNAADGKPVRVSTDTYYLLERAVQFSALSEGEFDVTIGALSSLWNIGRENARIPDDAEISVARESVGYEAIVFLGENTVALRDVNVQLDLGAIAKGYACDRVVEFLKSRGVTNAILDFGGNVYVFGARPDGAAFRVGIQSPIMGESGYVSVIPADDRAVVTSGIYERYLTENGNIYHHILDPHTGRPVENELASVTIIGPSSTDADALSTTCFLLGRARGMALLQDFPECDGIFITRDNDIYVTQALRETIDVTDSRFTLRESE